MLARRRGGSGGKRGYRFAGAMDEKKPKWIRGKGWMGLVRSIHISSGQKSVISEPAWSIKQYPSFFFSCTRFRLDFVYFFFSVLFVPSHSLTHLKPAVLSCGFCGRGVGGWGEGVRGKGWR